jgi:hypothetical protein
MAGGTAPIVALQCAFAEPRKCRAATGYLAYE